MITMTIFLLVSSLPTFIKLIKNAFAQFYLAILPIIQIHNSFSLSSDDDDFDTATAEAEAAALGLDTAAPEFYDAEADDKDERWVTKLRKGRNSDAILSCPLCFTTVCVDCQQHVENENQFRAMFVMNCRVDTKQIVKPALEAPKPSSRKDRGRRQNRQPSATTETGEGKVTDHNSNNNMSDVEEKYNPVYCNVCDNELGLREVGPEGAYHLFHVLASTS
jgi:E2F-associated phosphoprotein